MILSNKHLVMNEIKDESLGKYAQSSSDFTDNQTTTALCLLPQYNPLCIYNKERRKLIYLILFCCICRYTLVDIMPELKCNILNFGYGINFKYEEMLSHSFDRFYPVTTKFILPTIYDLKL